MAHDLDPQISSAIITTGGGLLTGIGGTLAALWRRARQRSDQDQRCERICTSMVSVMSTFVAVIEAIDIHHPAMTIAIRDARAEIAKAQAYLTETAAN
jgi:hypothetical protein